MRITPIEIRQKTFEAKAFRGIDKDEVQAFLTTLSQEWDKLLEENRQQKIALERAESQVSKMREVETGLYQTLKTAQDTSQNITQQAQQEADKLRGKTEQEATQARIAAQQEAEKLRTTAKQEADKLLADARAAAKKLVDDAQRESDRLSGSMQTRYADLEREHKQLQSSFDKLLADLRAAAATDSLPRTINYEQLYAIVLAEMKQPARLLEHLGQRILDRVLGQFAHIAGAEVSVSKFNPPLGGICHRARVTLRRGRRE